jgi:glycosyltransferase involved in cell wall biosynthesis
MNLLMIVPNYPHPKLPLSGAFNEKSAVALKELGVGVYVLAPRPYAPRLLASLRPRWRAYREIPATEVKNGIQVVRPQVPVVPGLWPSLWIDAGAFAFVCRAARYLHRRYHFDAILSFDLVGAGGVAWRVARLLGIPAVGWATGGDVRFAPSSSQAKVVRRALQRLDLIFYQSDELRRCAETLLSPNQLSAERHVVLPRGIAAPPSIDSDTRGRVRSALGIHDHEILVLSVGRLSREKGSCDLLDAAALARAKNSALVFRLLGASASFDETAQLQQRVDSMTQGGKIALLPACAPERVWDYLAAADIFAFTSHQEGMPNSLLEAMAMALPSVAFAIPPVLEINKDAGALLPVPSFDRECFAAALLMLADSPAERRALGERGRRRVAERFMATDNMRDALTRLSALPKLRAQSRDCARAELSRSSV